MLMTAIPVMPRGSSVTYSLRFQFLFIALCGLFLPAALLFAAKGVEVLQLAPAQNSFGAGILAAVLLLIVLRRLEQYPGVNVNRHILPTLAGIYGWILAGFVLFRLPYSNWVMVSCFSATLIARFAVAALNGRSERCQYLVIPGGRSEGVRSLRRLPSRFLLQPSLPQTTNVALIADLHHDHEPAWERLIAEAAIKGIPVYHYKQVWEATTGRVRIEHLSENSFGALIPSLTYRKLKRSADILVSLLALPLLIPFFVLVGLLIKLDSSGPALFRQKRMGYRGEVFEVIKFRTMTVTGDGEDAKASVTLANDQRVTRVGRILRRTRLDELPQVFNVLRGEMSWIGPRPEAVGLSRLYEAKLPFYRYRHIVRPGITGWAQVNQGHVTDIEQIDYKLQYDFYYIKNFSYWIDLLITFRTVRVVLFGTGAR